MEDESRTAVAKFYRHALSVWDVRVTVSSIRISSDDQSSTKDYICLAKVVLTVRYIDVFDRSNVVVFVVVFDPDVMNAF